MTQVMAQRGDGGAEVVVVPEAAALAREAAERFVQMAREAVEARGRFSVALAGGSTPGGAYRLLAEAPYRTRVPWEQVHIFWGDERLVPPDDPGSNYGLAQQAFIGLVPIPAENVHRVRGELKPEAAARAYELELEDYFCGPLPRLDLVILGLGSDGHTASLFPGSPLLEETSETVAVARANYQGRPAWRVTLTLPAINAARHVLFLAGGAEKAGIVAAVLGEGGGSLPAQRVCPVAGQVTWLLDRAAAAGLAGEPQGPSQQGEGS
jgi:6-phosphogluconolactonase